MAEQLRMERGEDLTVWQTLSWDGSEIDLLEVANVTIWCTVAPSVAYTVEARASSSAAWVGQTVVSNTPSSIGSAATIAAVGRHSLAGSCRLRLTGGTGGTFFVSGSQV